MKSALFLATALTGAAVAQAPPSDRTIHDVVRVQRTTNEKGMTVLRLQNTGEKTIIAWMVNMGSASAHVVEGSVPPGATEGGGMWFASDHPGLEEPHYDVQAVLFADGTAKGDAAAIEHMRDYIRGQGDEYAYWLRQAEQGGADQVEADLGAAAPVGATAVTAASTTSYAPIS